jgi:LmbE family N-acetylglucosaminyl deacetylase
MKRLLVSAATLMLLLSGVAAAQGAPRTLVAVFAHGDDEGPAGAVLARYAREGAQVYMIIVTDGAQGGMHTTIPRGPELARVRAEEARCAAKALGINPPILLEYPDGSLGNYVADPALLYRLTQRLHEEIQRLRPDALITWGPDGGTGHPDHRLVSNIVTQLVRAGAPGVPEHLFYSMIPLEGLQAMSPRGAPPMLVPQAKYLTVRVAFTTADFEAGARSLACHRTQFTDEVAQGITGLSRRVLNGVMPFSPLFSTDAGTDLLPVTR